MLGLKWKIDTKWLYNNQTGRRYFALYSTAKEEITLLYACKDDRAEYEHDLLRDIIGLKHRRNGEVILYVIVDQQKIPLNKTKAEVLKIAGTQKVQPEVSRSAFRINIPDIIPFVNDGDLLRYLPDDMLTNDQKNIKWDWNIFSSIPIDKSEKICYLNNRVWCAFRPQPFTVGATG